MRFCGNSYCFTPHRRELIQLGDCKMIQVPHLIEMPKQFHFQILRIYHVTRKLVMKEKNQLLFQYC